MKRYTWKVDDKEKRQHPSRSGVHKNVCLQTASILRHSGFVWLGHFQLQRQWVFPKKWYHDIPEEMSVWAHRSFQLFEQLIRTTCEFLFRSATSDAGLTTLAMAMPEESTNTMTTATTAETTSVQLTSHGQSEALFPNALAYHWYRLEVRPCLLQRPCFEFGTVRNRWQQFATVCIAATLSQCSIAKCIANAQSVGGFLVSKISFATKTRFAKQAPWIRTPVAKRLRFCMAAKGEVR